VITKKILEHLILPLVALAYNQAAIKKGNKSHTLNFPDRLPIKEKEKESAIKMVDI